MFAVVCMFVIVVCSCGVGHVLSLCDCCLLCLIACFSVNACCLLCYTNVYMCLVWCFFVL